MKRYKTLFLAACTAMIIAGCNNDDPGATAFDNKVYISSAEKKFEMLLKPTVPSYAQVVSTAIPRPMEKPVDITYVVEESKVRDYAMIYEEQAVLLPDGNYEIPELSATITPGAVKSTEVTVYFKELNLLDRNQVYVLPVAIADASNVAVLESRRTIYYVLRGAALINVVADLESNRAWPDWKNAAPVTNMAQFTLEALVYGNEFKNAISTLMGIEGQFLLRFGDNGVPINQLQIATSGGNLTNADLALEPLRWYHIAVTFDAGQVKVYIDGSEKLSGTVNKRTVNFGVAHSDEADGKPRCFWIGYSYNGDRYLNGRVSEVRIWNTALGSEQINAPDHFYQVDAASEGLVAYWKFDEGAGTTIKDHTSYGNNLTVGEEPEWVSVTLPVRK